MLIIIIVFGLSVFLFGGISLLMELIKIRKALEHIAYKKEVHEVIETDYPDSFEGDEGNIGRQKEFGSRDKNGPPARVKRYRKTKIKVIEEE